MFVEAFLGHLCLTLLAVGGEYTKAKELCIKDVLLIALPCSKGGTAWKRRKNPENSVSKGIVI